MPDAEGTAPSGLPAPVRSLVGRLERWDQPYGHRFDAGRRAPGVALVVLMAALVVVAAPVALSIAVVDAALAALAALDG